MSDSCPACGRGPLAPLERWGLPHSRCGACGSLYAGASLDFHEVGSARAEAESAKAAAYALGLDWLEALSPGRKLLDVGAGHGVFLEAAAARGWLAAGVEPDAASAEAARARGIDVRCARAEEGLGGPYAAVTLWDVLEMLQDPLGALHSVREALEEGGVAVVRARNARVHWLLHRLLRRRLYFRPSLAPRLHRFSFSPEGLRALFERAGLETVVVFDSSMTHGGPYGGSAALAAAKAAARAAAAIVRVLTRGRVLAGTSIVAVARRPTGRRDVLHLITRLDPGGSAESILRQAAAWDDPDTRYIIAAGGSTFPEGGPPVIRLKNLQREVAPLRDLRAFAEILRLLRLLRPAVVHTHSSKAGMLGRWAAALRRWSGHSLKVVHTPHGHVFYGYFGPAKSLFYRAVERACVPITDIFVALTEGEKRESLAYGLGSTGSWRVVPSGTEVPEDPAVHAKAGRELRARLGLDGIVVGSALRLERVKGPEVWIEASALAARRGGPPLTHLAVGDGPLRAGLERRAAELGVRGRWVFAGQVREVYAHLAAMDVYVQPSRNEGMGRALVAAQALGLPVAASRVCGIPWVVRDGESALLVPPDDPEALAAAIVRLAEDPELRKRLGEAGRRWVHSKDETGFARFSLEAAAYRLRRVYRELLG